MIGRVVGNLLMTWLTRKSYETGGKVGFDLTVNRYAQNYGPGGVEFAKARYRELMRQGWSSSRAAEQACGEALERFPRQ